MNNLSISVFLPAYNEEANIQNTILSVDNVLKKIASDYEILIIDDGSTDKTGEMIKKAAKNNSHIRMIAHSKNKGYGAALKTGLYAVRYPWVAQMDSDGQFDFSEINKFLDKKDKADLVIGYRTRRTDSFYRRSMAKILWLADFILYGLNVRDIDCGFKLFKKEVVTKLPILKTESAITVTEFIVRAYAAGFIIKQVGVHHYSRKEGKQTGGKPSIIFKAALQGIILWFYLLKEKIFK